MKTKVRLCKLLFSTRLLVSLLIILGFLECLHWLQGVGEGFPGSKDLILADYPELSSMKSSSNFHSSSHLPEKPHFCYLADFHHLHNWHGCISTKILKGNCSPPLLPNGSDGPVSTAVSRNKYYFHFFSRPKAEIERKLNSIMATVAHEDILNKTQLIYRTVISNI